MSQFSQLKSFKEALTQKKKLDGFYKTSMMSKTQGKSGFNDTMNSANFTKSSGRNASHSVGLSKMLQKRGGE